MTSCSDIPPYVNNTRICNGTIDLFDTDPTFNETCINWNIYYTTCESNATNPFRGAISFDNIGFAWVAIFQVILFIIKFFIKFFKFLLIIKNHFLISFLKIISLESWVTIMYFVQDAHSFWDWIYFVFLIVV
jgi:voltage-dependent calcium channel T type alpha-1G